MTQDAVVSEVNLDALVQGRQANLTGAMREADVDVLVLIDASDVEYARNDARPARGCWPIVVATADGQFYEFERPVGDPIPEGAFSYLELLRQESWMPLGHLIRETLGGLSAARIAVDRASIPCLRALQECLGHPRRCLVTEQGAAVASAARMVKIPEELECLRRSQHAMGLAMQRAQAILTPGVTYDELANEIRVVFAELDPVGDFITTVNGAPAATDPTPTIFHVAPGADHYTAAGEPSFPYPMRPSGPLQAGDVIWTDCSVRYNGYECDHGRTWLVGNAMPSHPQRDYFHRWVEVRDRMVEALRPGRTAADIIAAASEASPRQQPWLDQLYLAHSIGVFAGEYPLIGADPDGYIIHTLLPPAQSRALPPAEEVELREGMVLVLEPVIWDDGGAYRAEETYAITSSGPERISDWPYAPFE